MQATKRYTRVLEVAIQIGIIGLGVAICSFAKAQDRRSEARTYKGQEPGITKFQRDREDLAACKKYAATSASPIPKAVYDDCVIALEEGREIARHRATAYGCEDGYYSGLTFGLYDGAGYFSNDPSYRSMGDGEGYQAAGYINNGTQAAINKGSEYGTQSGSSDARNQWVNALDRGIPQANPQPKANLTFSESPYSNPYVSFNAAPFSLEQMASQANYDASRLQIFNYPNTRLCNDRSLMNSRDGFRVKSYYRNDGRYSIDTKRALDGKAAFNEWQSGRLSGRGGRGNALSHYNSIKGKTITVDAAEPPKADDRRGDGNNGPRGGTGNPASGATAPTGEPVKAPALSFNREQIFLDAFVNSYQYWAEQDYSRGYYDVRDEGTTDGWRIGAEVGTSFARQEGRIVGFNRKFREMEHKDFNESYRAQYGESFKKEFLYYATNPVVRAEFAGVTGINDPNKADDGLVNPGESVNPTYRLKNYGGVAANVKVRLVGPAIASSNEVAVQLNPVTSRQATDTRLVATFNDNIESGSQPEIYLSVQGGDQPQQAPASVMLTHQVTLEALGYVVVAHKGVINVHVGVLNKSQKIPTSDDVKIVITDNKGHSANANLGRLNINEEKRPAPIVFPGNEPMSLYNGEVAFSVQVSIGSKVVARSKSTQVVVAEDSKYPVLAAIFDEAAQAPGSAGTAKAASDALISGIIAEVSDERNNVYVKRPEGTLMNEVVKAFQARNPQSANAKKLYNDIAVEVRKYSRKLTTNKLFGRKSPGEKKFLEFVDAISAD